MTARAGRLLVVDDDPINRTLLARRLESEGHTVTTRANGREALEVLGGELFDAVLLDVVMPELDGYEVLAAMKRDEGLRHLPVIMVSALEEMDSVIRCIELGADDYLSKPFDPVLLRARISAGLARKRLGDLEREYLEQVAHVVEAAAAVESGDFDPALLEGVAAREDALGNLARVFRRMAAEVHAREQRLRREVDSLRIEIDEARAAAKIAEITETDYFHELQSKVVDLRSKGEKG